VNWFGGLVSHPIDADILLGVEFFGFNEGCPIGLYISQNSGMDWRRLEGMEDAGQIGFDGGGTGFLYVKEQTKHTFTLYGSQDLGNRWETLYTDKDTEQYLFAVAPGQTGWVYLYNQLTGNLRLSQDFGKNWETIVTVKFPNTNSLVVAPDDPQKLWLGGNGLLASTDGGRTWTERSSGLGRRGIVLKSDPYHAGQLYFEYVDHYQSCSLYHSGDGGASWKNITSRDESCYLEFMPDGETILSTSSNGIAWTSKDSGKTWDFAFQLPEDALKVESHPLANTIFFAVNTDGDRWVSKDSGRTWISTELPAGPYDADIYTIDGQRIYLAGAPGDIIYSNDGGQNWATCSRHIGQIAKSDNLAIDHRDVDHVLIATWGKGVQRSTDGCQSWQNYNIGMAGRFINSIVFDPNTLDIVYAGTDSGAHISFNGGESWNQINEGLLGATVVYSIVVDKDSNVYAATPYGIFKLEGK
jgi:photosystem II stability/assembly factor-like uncharacterized protein